MILRLLAATLLALPAYSANISLYDSTLATLPETQGTLIYADNALFTGGTASHVLAPGGTQLVTDNAVSAGFANRFPFTNDLVNPAFPALDRNLGFVLHFSLRVNSESHANSDRAGFSVLVLTEDSMGIELGFWANEIWAQSSSPLFTHAETAAFDTTAQQTAYYLQILGGNYSLHAAGSQILTGSLRDYTAFGSAPYTLSRFVFLGDNTSSARADVLLGSVSISDVPEPATWSIMGAGLVTIGFLRRRR